MTKKKTIDEGTDLRMEPNYAVNRVFTHEEENHLKSYIVTCSQMAYGLGTKMVKQLSFELAMANKKSAQSHG